VEESRRGGSGAFFVEIPASAGTTGRIGSASEASASAGPLVISIHNVKEPNSES